MIKILLIVISILLGETIAGDVCTSRASLIKIDEFYLKQPYVHEIELDLSNYVEEFQSIAVDAEKFSSIAIKYDSDKELDELETLPLIPFTPEYNLVSIDSTHQKYMEDCDKLQAKILEIRPTNLNKMVSILKTLNIDNTPIKSFIDRMKVLTNAQGDLLRTAVTPSTAEVSKMLNYYVSLNQEGNLNYPEEALTETSPVKAFCMKSNNQWDLKGSNRQKWLTTIQKILPSLSQAKAWGEIFRAVISNLPLQKSAHKQLADKLLLNTPLPLTRIRKFLNNFNIASNWESSIPFDFSKFTGFIDDFRSVVKLFKHKDIPAVTTTIRPQLPRPAPLLSLSPIDLDRLRNFINLGVSKINITGPIDAVPLFKHDNAKTITAVATFQQFSETDLIRIYHVKPLIYKNAITTIPYVISTFKNHLALVNTPVPFGCTTEDQNSQEVKICQGYTTPGHQVLTPEQSLDCGNSLAIQEMDEGFATCPIRPAPSTPLAHRAQCHNNTLAISSTKPLLVRIYCDSISRRPLKLENFPVYLDTDCEIRLIEGHVESILLPQLTTKFSQDRSLDIIPVTLFPIVVTTKAPAPKIVIQNTTIAPQTTIFNPTLLQAPWISPVVASVVTSLLFAGGLVLVCLCSRLGYCKTAWKMCKGCKCKSKSKSKSTSKRPSKSCCCWCCGRAKSKSSGDDLELQDKMIIKNPHYDPNTQNPHSIQETTPFVQGRINAYPPETAQQQPSAPQVHDDRDFFQNPDQITLQREISKSINTLNTLIGGRLASAGANLKQTFQAS